MNLIYRTQDKAIAAHLFSACRLTDSRAAVPFA
jgi:hypothetical protein